MANFVHKVGVIFHGQDRLTRHMGKIGQGFINLEAKQKAFERAQRQAEGTARHLAATEQKLLALKQRGIGVEQRVAAAEKQRYMQGVKYANMRAAAEKQFATAQERIERELTAMHKAQLAEREALDRGYAARQLALQKETDAAKLASMKAHNAAAANLAKTQSKYGNLDRRAQSMGYDSARQLGALAPASVAALQSRKGYLTTALGAADAAKHDYIQRIKGSAQYRNASVADQAVIESKALKAHEKQMAGMRQELAMLDKTLALQSDIATVMAREAALQEEINVLKKQRNSLETTHWEQARAIEAERKAAMVELQAAQKRMTDARAKADTEVMAREQKLYEQKLAHLTHLMTLEQRQSQAQVAALQMQEAQVATLIEEHQVLSATLAREVALEEQAAAAQQRRAMWAQRMQRWLGVSGGLATAGVSGLLGTAMTAGMVGYGVHKLIHPSAEVELQKQQIRNALRGEPGLANSLFTHIAKNDTHLPGNLRLSSLGQLEVFHDLIGAGMKGKELIPALAPTAQLIALEKTRNPKVNVAKLTRNFGTLYEKLGLTDEHSIQVFADQYAKGAAVSNRLNSDSLLNYANKMAPLGRALNINMNDTTSVDFLLGMDPTGRTVGTQMASLFTGLARGGTSEISRAALGALLKSGAIKMGKGAGFLQMFGKDVLDKKGDKIPMSAVPDFRNQEVVPMLFQMRDAILKSQGIDPEKWRQGKLTKEEFATVAQVRGKLANAKTGEQILAVAFDPTQQARYDLDRKRQGAAPGLLDQLKSFDNSYNMGLMRFVESMKELGIVAGTQLRGPMRDMLGDMTRFSDWTREQLERNDKLLPTLFEMLKWAGLAAAGVGGLKIALAGLNFVTLGLPATIAHGFVQGTAQGLGTALFQATIGRSMATAVASGAATGALSTGLAGTFAAALASPIVVGAVVAGMGVLLAWAIRNALNQNKPTPEGVNAIEKGSLVGRPTEMRPAGARPPSVTSGARLPGIGGIGQDFGAWYLNNMDPTKQTLGGKFVDWFFMPHKNEKDKHSVVPTNEGAKVSVEGGTHNTLTIKFEGDVPKGVNTNKLTAEITRRAAAALPTTTINTPLPFAPVPHAT